MTVRCCTVHHSSLFSIVLKQGQAQRLMIWIKWNQIMKWNRVRRFEKWLRKRMFRFVFVKLQYSSLFSARDIAWFCYAFAQHHFDDWDQVARLHLNLNDSRLSYIKIDHHDSIAEQQFQAMLLWMKKQSRGNSVKRVTFLRRLCNLTFLHFV